MSNAKHPKQIATPAFCIDCSSFIPADIGVANDDPRCRRFPMLDIVLGNKFFVACHAARGEGAPCGTDAKMFTPKNALEEPKNIAPMSVEPDKTNLN